MSDTSSSALPRQVADAYVDALIELDPITGTYLGVPESSRRLPDFSPAGQAASADLLRATLRELDAAERLPGADSDAERRCGRLLRERLTANSPCTRPRRGCGPSPTSRRPPTASPRSSR